MDHHSTSRTHCTCPKGFSGQDGEACTACLPGQFKVLRGPGNCDSCPPGATSPSASTDALFCSCSPGFMGVSTDACKPCSAGTFKASSGDGACQSCGASAVSLAGSAECVCLQGFLPLDNGPCQPCPEGSFKPNNGSESCIPCPPNSKSTIGSASVDSCMCGRGYTRLDASDFNLPCVSPSGLSVVRFTAVLQVCIFPIPTACRLRYGHREKRCAIQ